MDEEIERLVIAVRADTQGFARDVGEMRRTLDGPFGEGVTRAGTLLENSLVRAIRTGNRVAANVMPPAPGPNKAATQARQEVRPEPARTGNRESYTVTSNCRDLT